MVDFAGGKLSVLGRGARRLARLARSAMGRAPRRDARSPDPVAVSAYWSQRTYPANWYVFPLTSAYIIESITGQNEQSLPAWLFRHYFPDLPIARVLGVCCGNGRKEVDFIRQGFWGQVDAFDIAEGAVAAGARYAAEHGLADRARFAVMDFNRPDLLPETYTLAYCNGALHHLHELERSIAAIHGSLAPGGYLLASEFTGPTRYRYSDEDVRLVNEARRMLPTELGGDIRWSPRELQPKLDADPSEAARSEDIEGVLRDVFDALEARYYGGNVLMRALGQPFFAGFDEANPAHTEAVRRMIDFERKILAAGRPSHHAYFVARRRS